MKKKLGLFILLFVYLNANGQGIKFEENISWKEVQEKAKREHKYIFIDVYATWCGPCKEMDKRVYPDEKVGSAVNEKFISIKVQIDQTKEDGEHIKKWYADSDSIKNRYKVKVLPTFLIFSPEGKLVHRATGVQDQASFINIIENSLAHENQYYTRLSKYQLGKMDFNEMYQFALIANSIEECEQAKVVASNYINNYLLKLKSEELFSKTNLEFISDFMGNTQSKEFNLFFKNTIKVNAILGADKAEYKLRATIAKDYFPTGDQNSLRNPPNWDNIEKIVVAKFGKIGQEAVYGRKMLYYLESKDPINFAKYYKLYFVTALKRPEYNINNISWSIFEMVSDQKTLQYACNDVMKYAMEEWYSSHPTAYDTYANLLYKTGRKAEAIAWEVRALKLVKGIPEMEQVFQETLDKMRTGQKTWPEVVVNP